MSFEFKTETINTTETGRCYFVVENTLGEYKWECGYIQIDDDMPKDYDDEFYTQFDFWFGATFLNDVMLPINEKETIKFKAIGFDDNHISKCPFNILDETKRIAEEMDEWVKKK